MAYTTLIWDWNGTLLNDAAACVAIINIVLARRGLPALTAHRYRELFDFPVRRYYDRLGFDFTRESFEEIGSDFIARLRLQPGARDLLRDLHRDGIRQVVLSAYRHDTLLSLLREKRLSNWFTDVTGADDHYARGKSDQGIHLMKRLKLDRQHTLLIGDTVHDQEVAAAMGVSCVLLDAGHQARHRLEARGVPVLDDMRSLRDWLRGKLHVR